MGCSRFKSRAGCFLYGKLRRSDFLPVGEEKPDEVLERGYYSVSSDDEEGRGIEYAFGGQVSESEHATDEEVSSQGDNAQMDVDFE